MGRHLHESTTLPALQEYRFLARDEMSWIFHGVHICFLLLQMVQLRSVSTFLLCLRCKMPLSFQPQHQNLATSQYGLTLAASSLLGTPGRSSYLTWSWPTSSHAQNKTCMPRRSTSFSPKPPEAPRAQPSSRPSSIAARNVCSSVVLGTCTCRESWLLFHRWETSF